MVIRSIVSINHGDYQCPRCGERGFTDLGDNVICCDSCGSRYRTK